MTFTKALKIELDANWRDKSFTFLDFHWMADQYGVTYKSISNAFCDMERRRPAMLCRDGILRRTGISTDSVIYRIIPGDNLLSVKKRKTVEECKEIENIREANLMHRADLLSLALDRMTRSRVAA